MLTVVAVVFFITRILSFDYFGVKIYQFRQVIPCSGREDDDSSGVRDRDFSPALRLSEPSLSLFSTFLGMRRGFSHGLDCVNLNAPAPPIPRDICGYHERHRRDHSGLRRIPRRDAGLLHTRVIGYPGGVDGKVARS